MSEVGNTKTLKDDKAYFSAYANQALHNVFVTLSEINTRCIGKSSISKDTEMFNLGIFGALRQGAVGNHTLTLDDLDMLLGKLQYHFPFLRLLYNASEFRKGDNKNEVAGEDNRQETFIILKDLLEMLVSYRNFLTHEYGGTPTFNENVIHLLRNIFDANREAIKERYGYSPDDLKHLVRYDRNKKKYGGTKLRKNRNGFHYTFYEKGHALSEKGVVFLICLFLRPKDSFLFIKKFRGLKDSRSSKAKATIHCFTSFGIKPPHDSFVSNNSNEGLLLDIIGELNKVPGSVFNVLSKKNQDKFRPEIEAMDDEVIDETDFQSEIFLKRYRDRFEELALEYIDRNSNFANIRFAIHYGRFYYRVDHKTIINEKTNRWLTKDLIGFFKKEEVQEWKQKPEVKKLLMKSHELEKGHNKPYISDRFPEYVIQSNRLLISFEKGEFPELKIDESDPNNYKEPRGFDLKDTVFISRHDFHAFIFYALLVDDGNRVRGVIKEWINAFKRLKKDLFSPEMKGWIDGEYIDNKRSKVYSKSQDLNTFVKKFNQRREKVNKYLGNEYGLTVDEIPRTWRNHLMKINEPDPKGRRKAALKRIIDQDSVLLKDYEKRVKHFNQSQDRTKKRIQTGKIADILAKDMVIMMDINPGKKPNSSEFRELQKTMAYWGRYKTQLKNLFSDLKISSSIPYWENVGFTPNMGIYTFMQKYFKAKIEYLRKLNPSDPTYFLKIEMRKVSEDHLKASLKEPMYPYALPKGFFDQKCIELLKEQGVQISSGDRINRIINNYHLHNQPFYDYPRVYEVFNRWLDDRGRGQQSDPLPGKELKEVDRQKKVEEIKRWMNLKRKPSKSGPSKLKSDKIKKLLKYFYTNEKYARWSKVKDKLLFQLALKIIRSKTELKGWENLSLDLLSPNIEDSIFNRTISYTMEYQHKNSDVVYKITDREMKMKDFGKFRKLLKDRRLAGLLDLWDREEVTRQEIIAELDDYQKSRVELIDEIIAFEKRMIEKYKNHFDTLKNEDANGVVQHKHFLAHLVDKGKIDEETQDLLAAIRNKLCHNEYPMEKDLNGLHLDEDQNMIAKICEYAINEYRKLGNEKDET